MGAFFVVNERDPEAARALAMRLEASLGDQGFERPQRFGEGAVRVVVYPKQVPSERASAQIYRSGDGSVAALTGTAVIDAGIGEHAARACLARHSACQPDWQRWIGQFCALIWREHVLELFLDPLGLYKVYRRDDGKVFSSSFLAVAATVERPRVNPQGVYEYLAQEATYGDDTVLAGVSLAKAPGVYRLDGGECFEPWESERPEIVREASMGEHAQASLIRLRAMYDDLVAAFGGAMDTALSGGYDSRLILALLQEHDVEPHVHVYGGVDSADVMVARRIADAEGFALRHEDKSRAPAVQPEEFASVVERNFHAFDGYPCAGIFEGGIDLATRLERAADGRLALNGGGGEVFRNFFYLPDRPFSPREVVHSFYNRYAPSALTARFDERVYVEALAAKIARCLGTPRDSLTRVQVERVYPEFRCRYWMGRNNALNNRLGYAITPFVDPLLLPLTLAVPLKFKNQGRLEAAMINAVSPALARHASDYGHAFDVPPPFSRVLKDNLTLMRPPWLRRLTFRIRNRRPRPRGQYLQPAYVSQVIDESLPRLSNFVELARCYDSGTFQRACTLEYVFQRLDAQID